MMQKQLNYMLLLFGLDVYTLQSLVSVEKTMCLIIEFFTITGNYVDYVAKSLNTALDIYPALHLWEQGVDVYFAPQYGNPVKPSRMWHSLKFNNARLL